MATKPARLLEFLIELTWLSHKHGVVIRKDNLVIEERDGRYLIDPNNPGEGEGIEFKWEPE